MNPHAVGNRRVNFDPNPSGDAGALREWTSASVRLGLTRERFAPSPTAPLQARPVTAKREVEDAPRREGWQVACQHGVCSF